jgi:high-affinity K+ transport system ATPase subunit B
MKEKRDPNVKLLRSNLRNGLTLLLAASVSTAVLFLFVGLTYSRITLPRYTAAYDQKDTQQVVNLLITVVATVIGILLSHCRR